MLTKITLDNFRSFKNKTTVDLTKTNYTILPQNVADNGVLKGCIFVGANASGKSTIILGVKLLLDFLFSERNLNSGIFLCMFGDSPRYSLSYEFLIENKTVKYSFEVDASKNMISEKLWLDDTLMLERMGLSARSYIAEPNGVNYDETDVGKDTLFLRTLYFNTKFASNSVLSSWMDYLKRSIYINLFDKKIISYDTTELSVARYLEKAAVNLLTVSLMSTTLSRTLNTITAARAAKYGLLSERTTARNIFFQAQRHRSPDPLCGRISRKSESSPYSSCVPDRYPERRNAFDRRVFKWIPQ